MNCEQTQNLVSALLDHELDPSAHAQYVNHMSVCAICSQTYRDFLRLQKNLQTHMTNYQAPQQLRQRILSDLKITANKPAQTHKKKLSWAWINLGLASISTAAFVLSLSLHLAKPTETDLLDQEIVASHFRSLMENHLSDVASSDQHTVKPWFTGKLDYVPPVVDLAQQGFPLLGGRLDYLNQQAIAALVYKHGNHTINLFVWPNKNSNNQAAKATSIRGFHLLHWTVSGMNYEAISDLNSRELANFHALLLSQNDKDVKDP